MSLVQRNGIVLKNFNQTILDNLLEIPLYIEGENDGVFNLEDKIIFYGRGVIIDRRGKTAFFPKFSDISSTLSGRQIMPTHIGFVLSNNSCDYTHVWYAHYSSK